MGMSADPFVAIRRRFIDVLRKESGEWRQGLRRANVVSVE
jgi:hypothetical protein